jgi:thymidylate synthase
MKARLGLQGGSFEHQIIPAITYDLANAPEVHVGEWQAIRNDAMPQMETIEVEDISFWTPIPASIEDWQNAVLPNLPWAEEHFRERVSGIPYNPPPSHVRWPFAQRSNSEHTDADQRFSHTYPERFWPPTEKTGIRFHYGNLDNLVDLLKERPDTRQAYLPVWFPEDISASLDDERVPCTLGYHFLIRLGALKVTYYIRSCDFFRHFRDDVYMAGRLAQWICSRLNENREEELVPSRLVMHISSMHIFSAERGRISADANRLRTSQYRRPPDAR